MPVFNRAKSGRLAAKLETWFADSQRDLPWRKPMRDTQQRAYRCLVAEFMLHQTQVVRVLEFYERFITRFATIQDLAAADEQEVLALWQGLGYYRRARLLHACAKQVVTEHDGCIPSTPEQLIQLPGIGRYTAGALASIAFGCAAPIVDGNVARVMARLTDYEQSVDHGPGVAHVWAAATDLVQKASNPGNLNQAMMELGSTVCTPANPECRSCPVRRMCAARKQDTIALRPKPKRRAVVSDVYFTTVVVRRAGRLLLQKRPATGLWSSMWQCPTLESEQRLTNGALTRFVQDELGYGETHFVAIGQFVHQTSHRRVHFDVHEVSSFKGRPRTGTWVRVADLPDYPISNATRRILAMLSA